MPGEPRQQEQCTDQSMEACLEPLVQHLSAHWPRRGNLLLEIGCGEGRLLDMLWTRGFDVTGLDNDPDRVQAARERLGNRGDFQLGAYDALPYDDHAFEHVVLLTVFEQSPELESLLREAVRVAAKSLLIVFPNKWSLAWLSVRMPWKHRSVRTVYSLPTIQHQLRTLCPGGAMSMRSILPGPPCTWHARSVWKYINRWLMLVPLGAYVGLRLDMLPSVPMTGLPLLNHSRLSMSDSSTLASCEEVRRSMLACPAARAKSASS